MSKYTQEEIDRIVESVSVIDYFLHLEQQGKLKYDSKKGRDYFFRSENDKFSVSEKGFYSFYNRTGGQILKAVMTLENKSWKDALDFLADFTHNKKVELIAERKKDFETRQNNIYTEVKIQYTGVPNNDKLLAYFEDRGISKEILQAHTKQVHYEHNGKKYFGIGLTNYSGGLDIRNPLAKIKIGKNDISAIKGEKNEMIVFEGMTDMLSFLQLQESNGNQNSRTLVSLNSIENVDRFISIHKNFEGKIFLCLDGDKGGNLTTSKILLEFAGKNIKDIRPFYSISEQQNNDLNDYLKNKLGIQQKNSNFNQQKEEENGIATIEPQRIPDTRSVERSTVPESNTGESVQEIQSEQNGNNGRGQDLVSNNAGDGSTNTERSNSGSIESGRGSNDQAEQIDAPKSKEQQHSLGGRLLEETSNIPELDELISKYIGQKLTNEQVAEVVSAACFVSDEKKVLLREDLIITDDLKNIANQFKSGGIAKEGRGILDEYYTDTKIVESIRNLIRHDLKDSKTLHVLEPSIGTGNFVYAVKDIDAKTFVTGFEINDTTAKIAKIFHAEADINLRSFETEFIDEQGIKTNKLEYINQFDVVVGNPPYGEHRGFYKGLGEEPKIAKYEDYFVKRSLDVLKDGGVLAMVLPSGWLNRHKKLEGAEISNAFRLPIGAFAGTQVGTDIIILRKNSLKKDENVSNYFDLYPEKILGEIKEKSNRFGRMELYVSGNIEEALQRIEEIQNRNISERIGNLFDEVKDDSNSLLEEVQNKVSDALEYLNDIKFKTPAIKGEIQKLKKNNEKLKKLSPEELKKIFNQADKIIQSKVRNSNEYYVQTKPDIKSKILKYHFKKEDNVVPAALQNSNEISREQIAAFRDANYDGTLKNRGEHAQFANFINGKWVHDFYYAEGNIYQKLAQLEIDFKDKHAVGELEEQYNKQLNLLLSVIPKPKRLDEIFISPNHEFVHKFDLGQVEKERYNYSTKQTVLTMVDYNLAEKFKDFVLDLPTEAFAGSSSWEVRQFVDNQSVAGSDKERNALVRERRKAAANDLFQKFIREELTDDLKERFVKDFNTHYNNIHVPDYSRFPLFSNIYENFKGRPLRLSEVQKAGVGRQTTKGVGLLAHEVGFGKTLSGILSMHEAMERGNAKRPLIVVPNDSILKQWVDTIFEVIPDAKVNVLGNLGKDYDLSRFDNFDSEITIVTYEGFNNIGFSNETTERLASKFNYISASELKSITNTEREIQIDLQKEKETEGKMKRGKIYDWIDFGFDHLTFDEVHNANHIVGKVKIEDRGFASDFRNQNQQTSKIGINTWMAAQYIQEKYDGRNITLLSATPFTNKPLEYYSILSLIGNKRLEESGYFNVNTFFETFMEADTDMEIDAKGDVKFKANVRRFKNNTLFQKLLSEFIDIKGEEDNPELIRPIKINKEYKIEQNDLTMEQYESLNDGFNEQEKGAILTHILNARLIAISPYLSPYYHGEIPTLKEFVENSPKLNETMKLIRQNKKDLPDAGQIIYSELATAHFPKLKDYLVKEIGYQPEEVGIITGETSKKQRLIIQDNFNSGKMKIVIGSEAIQEGMNLQITTSDIYLLSLPYNFTALRQVEGRAWRQGNQNENVRINFMLTNDSIDVFMLQKLQTKQARYLEAMKKGADVLDISDIDTQELKTAIITNPVTRANIEIEVLKKKIESEKNRYLADSSFVLRKFEKFGKLKDEVKKAENAYNNVVGWANNGKDGSEYWKNQLPSYQNSIDLAQYEVDKAVQILAEKGVNVAEIEKQIKITEDKVWELDQKLENLPDFRVELMALYKLEKEKLQKKNADQDHVKDRELENQVLFKSKSEEVKQNIVREEPIYYGRSR